MWSSGAGEEYTASFFVWNTRGQTGYKQASSGAGEGRLVKDKHFASWLKGGRGVSRKEGRTGNQLLEGSRWVTAKSHTSHLLDEEVGAAIECSEKSRWIT